MGQCYNSIVVPASADDVWAKLRNFHDFSWSANVITKVDIVGDKGANEIGAQRKLNDAFEETLLELNDDDRSMRYSIDNGPPPIRSTTTSAQPRSSPSPRPANASSCGSPTTPPKTMPPWASSATPSTTACSTT